MDSAPQLRDEFVDVLAAANHPLRRQRLICRKQNATRDVGHAGDSAIILWQHCHKP